MVESAAEHFGIASIDDYNVTDHSVYSSYKVEQRLSEIFGGVVEYHTTEYYNSHPSLIYPQGTIIVYSDYYLDEASGKYIPGIKVSTGTHYAIDLPFITKTLEESVAILMQCKTKWDNKLNCEDQVVNETLILNRN